MKAVKIFYDPLGPLPPEMLGESGAKAKLQEIAGPELSNRIRQISTNPENGQSKKN